MLESVFAYAEAHAWARWAMVGGLFAPPLLLVAIGGQRGLESLSTIVGWLALVLVALLLIS